MKISSKIELGELRKQGWTAHFDYRPKSRDGQLVVSAYYIDDTFSSSLRETGAALIDTVADAVTFQRDTRCGGFSTSVLADNGDLYFASDPYIGGSIGPAATRRARRGVCFVCEPARTSSIPSIMPT